jgi:hypothetical protein
MITSLGAAQNHQQRVSTLRGQVQQEINNKLHEYLLPSMLFTHADSKLCRGNYCELFHAYGMEILLAQYRQEILRYY